MLISFLSLFFSLGAFSQVFNSNISEGELGKVRAGGFIIRDIGMHEKICLDNFENAEAQSVIDDIRALNPNYLVEVLMAKPASEDDDGAVLEKFAGLMMDVPAFSTIKYVSSPKFKSDPDKKVIDEAEIISSRTEGEYTFMKTELRLKPLNRVNFDMNYYLSEDKSVFYYQAKNNEPATFKNIIKCVNADRGRLLVIAFKKDGYWFFYGVGGAKTLAIPFLKSKIDREIMNRAKDFVQFYYDQM